MFRFAPLLLLVGLTACTCDSGGVWVSRLEVDAFEGGDIIALSKSELTSLLEAQLRQAKFNLASNGRPVPSRVKPWRMAFAAGVGEPDSDARQAPLELVLELSHTGEGAPFSIDRRRRVELPAGDVEAAQAAIREALADGMALSVREAAALIRLEDSRPASLQAKLKDSDEAVRAAAIKLLVRRHDYAALPVLLAELKENRELDVLRVVVGQLVELGAVDAVDPLIDAASRRGPVFEREVLFAVGAIGGESAEAYLDLVATGHDDELLRLSAETALAELRERRERAKDKGATK